VAFDLHAAIVARSAELVNSARRRGIETADKTIDLPPSCRRRGGVTFKSAPMQRGRPVMNAATEVRKGLEGVVADSTSISQVDGPAGRLYYRGQPIEALARLRFAEAMHLVVFGELPAAARLTEVEEYLWSAGRLPWEIVHSLRELARHGAHPVATLQAITPLLALDAPSTRLGRTPQEEEGLVIAARFPAALAVMRAALQDHPAPSYPESRQYGARYLQLLRGHSPIAAEIEAFECMQILQLEHGFNASTFAARVVTSSLAPPAAALSAALGALSGPLHGGAAQAAIEMAFEIGAPERAAAFVTDCLAGNRIVMGIGHREYRQVDPRSKILRQIAERIAQDAQHRGLFDILSAVDSAFAEQTWHGPRVLRANLELYKGVVCLALGIPKEFFTATFAAARVFGWVAHSVEQRQNNP
jgi:citrate synthase